MSPSPRSETDPFPTTVDYRYPWGDALDVLEEIRPAARIVNLGNQRHHERRFLAAKRHSLPDASRKRQAAERGPNRLLCSLKQPRSRPAGLAGYRRPSKRCVRRESRPPGAGENAARAASPAIIEIAPEIRLAVFGYGTESSGVPASWAARQPFTRREFHFRIFHRGPPRKLSESISGQTRPEDLVIFSVHWGGNWGYDVPEEQVRFAHQLIDSGAVDVVHGHSSHHVRPLEVYRGKLILYGAGDFLNDYEGIEGNEGYRDDLALDVLPTFESGTGRLVRLRIGSASNFPVQPAAGFGG